MITSLLVLISCRNVRFAYKLVVAILSAFCLQNVVAVEIGARSSFNSIFMELNFRLHDRPTDQTSRPIFTLTIHSSDDMLTCKVGPFYTVAARTYFSGAGCGSPESSIFGSTLRRSPELRAETDTLQRPQILNEFRSDRLRRRHSATPISLHSLSKTGRPELMVDQKI
jgi:hypothetical protein